MNIVPLSKSSSSAIDYARQLLARCESGETIAVTALEEYKGGLYEVLGSTTLSRTQTAGMFLEAAITRLNDGE